MALRRAIRPTNSTNTRHGKRRGLFLSPARPLPTHPSVSTVPPWRAPTGRTFSFPHAIAKSPATGGLQHIQLKATNLGQSYAGNTFAWVHPKSENFTYDADGNLLSDGLWNYAYDAENRLTGVYSQYADETGRRLAVLFTYDYLDRRVAKNVYDYDGTKPTTCRLQRLFVYQDDGLIAEYSASTTDGSRQGLLRTCTWGPDLGGGVGGLLALKDYRSTFAGIYRAAYDGNGNLTALTGQQRGGSGRLRVRSLRQCSGSRQRAYASENPFRFSTKYYDIETGLYDYGYRYYNSSMGRFVNRDPIKESGGVKYL